MTERAEEGQDAGQEKMAGVVGWELELSPHLMKRMVDRRFNEVDLRTMMQRATSHRENVVEGRWVIETRHQRRPWEVIVEPDPEEQLLVIVTAYEVWNV